MHLDFALKIKANANLYILMLTFKSLLQERINSLTNLEMMALTRGDQKTTNYDVSTLIGDGTTESVSSMTSSPVVLAVMVSIILNIAMFAILYYQVLLEIEIKLVMKSKQKTHLKVLVN